MQQPEAPLFRMLAHKWRPVDRRERRMKPFQLALAAAEAAPPSRGSFNKKKIIVIDATVQAKSARKWNPWMMMK